MFEWRGGKGLCDIGFGRSFTRVVDTGFCTFNDLFSINIQQLNRLSMSMSISIKNKTTFFCSVVVPCKIFLYNHAMRLFVLVNIYRCVIFHFIRKNFGSWATSIVFDIAIAIATILAISHNHLLNGFRFPLVVLSRTKTNKWNREDEEEGEKKKKKKNTIGSTNWKLSNEREYKLEITNGWRRSKNLLTFSNWPHYDKQLQFIQLKVFIQGKQITKWASKMDTKVMEQDKNGYSKIQKTYIYLEKPHLITNLYCFVDVSISIRNSHWIRWSVDFIFFFPFLLSPSFFLHWLWHLSLPVCQINKKEEIKTSCCFWFCNFCFCKVWWHTASSVCLLAMSWT